MHEDVMTPFGLRIRRQSKLKSQLCHFSSSTKSTHRTLSIVDDVDFAELHSLLHAAQAAADDLETLLSTGMRRGDNSNDHQGRQDAVAGCGNDEDVTMPAPHEDARRHQAAAMDIFEFDSDEREVVTGRACGSPCRAPRVQPERTLRHLQPQLRCITMVCIVIASSVTLLLLVSAHLHQSPT